MEKIVAKILEGQRITREEALTLWQEASFFDLGFLARETRFRLHPERVVTYIVDRNINYTNICISGCKFCAYYRSPETEGGFVLSKEELFRKIEETLSLGGVQILLQGGLNPDLPFSFYLEMLKDIKERFPEIHIHGFSPPEIIHFTRISGKNIEEVLKDLIAAGLNSIPGGGAEILVDRVRQKISPHKCSADEWLEVMRVAHRLGLKTTATMMFGHIETVEERIEHLARLRDLQDETGGFTAFIPWPFQPGNTELKTPKVLPVEYLKMLALSRIFLDNIKNIQASWVTQGPKVAQVALEFGANDFGSTMIEENVVAAAGVSHRLSIEEIERLIKDAGYTPRRRKMDYSLI
ncbi:cyclic dehypoxanthinyl futalosine synthase [Thermodesulfatator autotrophicus]|uniref:Cyclic dehypoxanthine futalosine synthase n=1 Tax=Thermodesulfatator autotrophicus TaxID=1795632 RepID=A0A177E4H2_9BACT|nr:cyclic dehypoxanthinyl futalosine synthase [Thermodesulfatator autotrophicus]OAG26857.1 dehypoxanthine futalosine cyclase [Thermodesulfatator autotrophicus]